jgi:outer membrane protein OmpA-like peptidoglycan-associated protein
VKKIGAVKKINLLFILLLVSLNLLSQESKWVIQKLPECINSSYDEIAPVPSRDGKKLFFTRVGYPDFIRTLVFDSIDYSNKLNQEEYSQTLVDLFHQLGDKRIKVPHLSAFNQDVWVGITDSLGNYIEAHHPSYPLNNALTNSLVALTPDPNRFYIVNQFHPTGGMKKGFSVIKQNKDGSWNFPEPITIKDYYTLKSDVNLTMSFDGKVLILSAQRFDSKDLDLYICFKEGEEHWSAPIHLGNTVNSSKREMTPYLSENNTTLFFSSDRGDGLGGLDIYMTRREGDDWFSWSSPILLVNPINSKHDESQPYFNMTTGYLYFTSKRDGSSDIFRTQIAPPQPTEIEIKGRVLNKNTNELIDLSEIEYQIEGNPVSTFLSTDGIFTLKIPKGIKTKIRPIKTGYNGWSDSLFFRHDYYYFKDYYTVDLIMEPLKMGGTIELRNLYFQQSKAIIKEDSYQELDHLVEFLTKNPTIEISVEGHTDNVGKMEDLIQLSTDRANSVKEFLINSGINVDRISIIGHGPTNPITSNSSEVERSKNRRVEIKITKL